MRVQILTWMSQQESSALQKGGAAVWGWTGGWVVGWWLVGEWVGSGAGWGGD